MSASNSKSVQTRQVTINWKLVYLPSDFLNLPPLPVRRLVRAIGFAQSAAGETGGRRDGLRQVLYRPHDEGVPPQESRRMAKARDYAAGEPRPSSSRQSAALRG